MTPDPEALSYSPAVLEEADRRLAMLEDAFARGDDEIPAWVRATREVVKRALWEERHG